jgi:hypothetical protein
MSVLLSSAILASGRRTVWERPQSLWKAFFGEKRVPRGVVASIHPSNQAKDEIRPRMGGGCAAQPIKKRLAALVKNKS